MAKAKGKGNQTAEVAKKNIQSLSAAFDDDFDIDVKDDSMDDALAALFDEIDVDEVKQDLEKAESDGIEMIDINKLIPNDLNRYQMDEDDESYKAIKATIIKVGFMKGLAIIGEKRGDGNVTIISGHRRTKIAKSLGIEKVPITYIECGSDVNRLRYSIRTNLHRKDSVRDILYNYKAIEEFFDAGAYDPEEIKAFEHKRYFIANELGVEESKLRNLVFLLSVDERIWKLIDKDVVTTSAIRSLYGKRNDLNKVYNEIIKELSTNVRLLDGELPLKDRQAEAKLIIDKIKEKKTTSNKKSHKEINKLCKTLMAINDPNGIYDYPVTDIEKSVMLNNIEQMERTLKEIKMRIIT